MLAKSFIHCCTGESEGESDGDLVIIVAEDAFSFLTAVGISFFCFVPRLDFGFKEYA